MKPPKWLVLCLVGATILALIGALWLWIDLPVTTARSFLALVAEGKFDEANEIMIDARWEKEEMYLFLEAGDRKVVLPMKDWKKSFSDVEVGFFSRTISDFVCGRCSFQGKETRFGTYGFTARLGTVQCDTDFDKLKVKTGWGFTAAVPDAKPFNVRGTYNWCDPKGGTINLEVGEKRYDTKAAFFGSGYFELDCTEAASSDDRQWCVEFLDSSGKSVRKLQGGFGT